MIEAYRKGIRLDFQSLENSVERLAAQVADLNVCTVLGTDDMTTEIASRVSRRAGLTHNPPPAVAMTRRKDLARQCLWNAGLPSPRFQIIPRDQDINTTTLTVAFPAVLKPISLSGSRGVIRVDDRLALSRAMQRLNTIVDNAISLHEDEKKRYLLESFIPGFEVAVEGMLDDGDLEILAIFDKPDPLNGPYFEETYYISPTRLDTDTQEALAAWVQRACQAFGLRHGAIHAECRINDTGIYVIELAARTIGGLCAKMFEYGTGYGLEQLVLANAMGERLPVQRQNHGMGVLMIPIPKAGLLKRINGLAAARAVPDITDLQMTVSPGHELIPLPEGNSYLGFIFSQAADAATAEKALRTAHEKLHFTIDPIWKIC